MMAYQISFGAEAIEWPYPIKYGVINNVDSDVLVIGAGIAGGAAGIAAARRGAKVVVVDKAPIKRSGCGGAGLDHWNSCFSNPKSPLTPEEYMDMPMRGKGMGHRQYIGMKGSWDALMELEKMGMPVRDEDLDFIDSRTRDSETGIMKSIDYENMVSIKMRGGHYIKPVLFDGLKEAGAIMYERVMTTSLLTEGGKQGNRVVGATGFNMQTGEFYVFHSKCVIISTGPMTGMWIASTEITGNSFRWDPNDSGEGVAIAWQAGAEVYGMDKAGSTHGGHPFAWPRFGVGNPDNTWFPCTIVDNNGKVIPWEYLNNEPVASVADRNKPGPGQMYTDANGNQMVNTGKPLLCHDLPERIRSGEFELPLWADLSSMPEVERKGIWGMMIGNEGKTRFTLYDYYTRLGFDPDKDMLWCPIMAPENYGGRQMDWFQGEPDVAKPWRSETFGGQGSLGVDWNCMTSIEGLFAAGAVAGMGGSGNSTSSGFYAGNRAAEMAKRISLGDIDKTQLEAEIKRVYAPVNRADDPKAYVSWKELWAGIARALQICCGEYKTVPIMQEGLFWLDSIAKTEMQQTFARNPHELARVLECETRMICAKVFLSACIAHIQEEEKGGYDGFLFNKLKDNKVENVYKENYYWLKAPYAPTYLENYELCRANETEAI